MFQQKSYQIAPSYGYKNCKLIPKCLLSISPKLDFYNNAALAFHQYQSIHINSLLTGLVKVQMFDLRTKTEKTK